MRTYPIGSGSTIFADTGLYNQFQAAVFSSVPSLGTGAGATLQGPTNPGRAAGFSALGYANDGIIDVNDANFVTIKNIGLSYGLYGLWSLGGSQNLTLSNVTAFQAAQDGVRIESNSSASSLDHINSTGNGHDGIFIGGTSATLSSITASSNAGDGIYINGNFTSLTNSTADSNGADGYDFPNAGAAVITNDEAHGDQLGIYVNNPTQSTTTMVGNTNLAAGQGNIFHDNLSKGIEVGIGVTVAGNTVYGQSTSGGIGIQIDNACIVTNNVVWGNAIGINDSNNANPVSYNRVFDNSSAGIALGGGSSTLGDVIYSNGVGLSIVDAFGGPSPIAANDLIYANASGGVSITNSSNLQLLNNTIYQITGDAVLISTGSSNISLRNNILWSKGGYDIEVASTSENGFSADYNLFYTTNTGKVGFWDGVARSTLALWRTATATDTNSLYAQPLFVNVSSNDQSIGYSSGVDHGATDDFHDQSTGGSFHGGALAPVINSTSGLPVALAPTLTNDASTSPAVDRGDPASSFTNEPAPNGGFVNIGAYGNTAQASDSATSYVVMLNPNGGESLIAGKNYTIKWRSQDTSSTVKIDLLQGSSPQTATVVSNIATTAPNSGQFVWSIPSNITAATNYYIRVTRNDTSASGTSAAAFTILATVHAFYINDSTVQDAHDLTTVAGDDNNDGLSPSTPKATLQAMLQAYDLGPGDTIFVDNGTYTLTGNVVITASDAGVAIVGYHDPSFPTRASIFNRNNTGAGTYAFDVQSAAGVTLDHLTITGGLAGINASGSTGLAITNDSISANADFGINIGGGNTGAQITGNTVFNQINSNNPSDGAIAVTGSQVTISNNQVYGNANNGILVNNGLNTTISGNLVHDNLEGIFANNAIISGNIAYNNAILGIRAYGTSQITGNTAYNNTNSGALGPKAGIEIDGGTATGNVAYGQAVGMLVSGSNVIASNNLVYNNATAGIQVNGSSVTVSGNVVHDNGWGIQFLNSNGALATNNVLYSNSTGGMDLQQGGTSPTIKNNTIYQTTGDGVRVELYNARNAADHPQQHHLDAKRIRSERRSQRQHFAGQRLQRSVRHRRGKGGTVAIRAAPGADRLAERVEQ